MEGWIKLHRKITEWEWYGDNNTFRLFIHLLLKANHKDKRFRGQVVKAGSILTGRDLLSKETGLSVQQIRTCLERLKSTNELTINSSRQGTVIYIVKYKDYQIATNDLTNNQPTSNQQATTNKNVNNENNVDIAPSEDEFVAYGIENDPKASAIAIRNKYRAWKASGWKDGNGKEVKNWKSKLLNTLKYLHEEEKPERRTYIQHHGIDPN